MFILHVDIVMAPGKDKAAESVFAGPFKTAITAQPGFRDVRFLRPDDGGSYVLTIAFDNQPQQQAWVATDLHTDVWGQMEANFTSYAVRTFHPV